MLINFTVLFSIVTGPLHFHCFLVSIDWLSGRLLDPIFSIPICTLIRNVYIWFSCCLTLISPAWLLFSTYSICSYSLIYTYQNEPFNLHSAPCIKQCTFSTVKPHFTAWRLYACRGEHFEQTEYFPYSPRWPITWTRREIQQMAP